MKNYKMQKCNRDASPLCTSGNTAPERRGESLFSEWGEHGTDVVVDHDICKVVEFG